MINTSGKGCLFTGTFGKVRLLVKALGEALPFEQAFGKVLPFDQPFRKRVLKTLVKTDLSPESLERCNQLLDNDLKIPQLVQSLSGCGLRLDNSWTSMLRLTFRLPLVQWLMESVSTGTRVV